MPKLNSQKWLNSDELIEQCEISKPTLDYYIKLGIVPKPIVRHDKEGLTGYFPPEVVSVIDKVKRLKDEGETMEEIVRTVKNTPAPEKGAGEHTEKKRYFYDERAEKIIKDTMGAENR